VYNLEGGLEDMVVEEVLAQAPVWLPDGSGLLTGAAHPGGEGFEAHILRVDLRSREVKELETNLEALEIGGLTIGPDGKRLAFSAAVVGEGGGRDLYLLDLENGTAAERLEDDPRVAVTGCRFGPDGFALACQQITLGQAQAAPMVVLMRLDGSGVVVLAEDAALPSWLP
jgi:Tol biopolymer transport system component